MVSIDSGSLLSRSRKISVKQAMAATAMTAHTIMLFFFFILIILLFQCDRSVVVKFEQLAVEQSHVFGLQSLLTGL